ncbi:MAG TPA: hypothetical protein VF169_10350 [Albitalea sp.]|uniref:hypothetical protein n=1 Tax=Piscinibacter sp. TaxID=1903157 RepID=UPI002ED33F26
MIALSVMPIDLLAKAAMSAAAVGVLLSLLRQAGPRASGLAAAVPVNSLPALFWLSVERGGPYAACVAWGSLAGTLLTLLLGALALLLGQRHGGRAAPAVHGRGGRRTALLSMVMAGAMSALVSSLSRHGSPHFCGLVATLPVLAGCATFAAHRKGGVTLALQVLGGYLDAMWAKAAFLAALGWAWAAGAGSWAWAAALAGASIALLARGRVRNARAGGVRHG